MINITNTEDNVQCEIFRNDAGIAVRFRDLDSGQAFDQMRVFEHFDDAINYALDCVNAYHAVIIHTGRKVSVTL